MSRVDPIYTSFNGGEVSPLLGGRPDLEKWNAALQTCENLIPLVQGALTRRGGTRHVAEVKDSSDQTWLMPFVFSRADAYQLEFGDGYIRFYRDRGVLTLGSPPAAWSAVDLYEPGELVSRAGVNYYCKAATLNNQPPNATYWYPLTGDIYEIPSPFAVSDLTDPDDGSLAIKFEQSGDIIYMTHRSRRFQPRKLTRRGGTDWIITLFEPIGGPFKEQNTNEGLECYATGATAVGATCSFHSTAPLFTPDDVGSLFYIEVEDGVEIRPWAVYQKVLNGDVRRSDGKFYICTGIGGTATQVTGQEKPIHASGEYWDGDGQDFPSDTYGSIGAAWTFQHPGYGWGRITGFTSALEATAVILSTIPAETSGSNNTFRWAKGAWSTPEGWPDNVCFFRERLTFFRDTKIWGSVAGDYENFKAKENGETLPDSAVSIDVQSAQGNAIQWVKPMKGKLFVGTNAGETSIGQQTTQQAFGPGNTQQSPETSWGGVSVAPLQVGASVLFADKTGRRLRKFAASASGEGFDASDLNKYRGALRSGITWIAWAQSPHEVAWAGCTNGDLKGFTFMEEDGVAAWHTHPLGGSGLVESGSVIPSPDGSRDDLWMIVRRTINGQTRRYVEYIGEEYDFAAGGDPSLSAYSDSSLVYDGAPTSVLSGLGHLEGQTVNIKVNGAAHPSREVVGAQVDLDQPATKATAGLAAPYKGKLMPIEAGGDAGTSQGKAKRINRLTIRLLATLGGRFGPDFGKTDPLEYRQALNDMDEAPPLFTGDKVIEFPGDYDGAATIAFEGSDDFPFTLIALMPELKTS